MGARMGGVVKPLLRYRGRSLLAHAIDALAPHCAEILVMAGPHAAGISREAEGARVLADPGEGPHVALRLALEAARSPIVVVAPGDSPFLAPVIDMLVAAGPNAVVHEGAGINPLIGIYERAALAAALHARVRSMQEAAATLRPGLKEIDAPEGATRDADSPEDLSFFERSARR